MTRFLFKLPQPKRFSFQPRYYNEDREALQMRIKAIKSELGQGGQGGDPDALRGRLRYAWKTNTNRSQVRKSNKNIFIIAALLGIIAYLVLY